MRTLLVCALATTLVGCSSQQSKQPSCVGLNPLACLTAVDVPIEPASYDSDAATTKPVSRVAWRSDSPPRPHAQHAVRRTPKPIKVAAKASPAVPIPVRSPQANQQTTDNAVASETARVSETAPVSETALAGDADPQTTTDVPNARTAQEQVAAASAVAERMSVPTLDASLDALVAVLVTGPDIKSVPDLAGKAIAIDDRYSEQSIRRVRTAMVAAGALEVQLSKGQTSAINRLVGKEVSAAVVGLVSANAASSFPEIARFRTFQVPLSPRSGSAKP